MPDSAIYAASWLINPDADPLPGGAIAVSGGAIIATGALADLRRDYPGAPVVEYPGCAILPGLVNAHTHLELTHFSSWRLRLHVEYNPRRFVDWMIQLIKIKRGLTAADHEASIREGARMCLESGTTAIGEIAGSSATVPLYCSSRLGGRLFFELLGHDPARFRTLLGEALAACDADCSAPFLPGLSPHTAYTIAEGNLPLIREAALGRSLPLAIHLSESLAETAFIFDTSGPLAEELYPFIGWERYLTPPRHCTSTELLDRAGLLTPSTLAVHCVHVTLNDAEILKRRGVHAALCPRSNERLDVGRAPLALLRKLGIPLALGTDSLASNESLSLWDEMRFALDAFPHELSPRDVLQMATGGSAAALGISASCGSLEPGKRADFQVIGNVGTAAEKLLERIISEGEVEEVYTGGERYAGVVLS
ncbi:MAG: amidohydrolase family protein [Deltaproteobacteria bacterium]|nr:amidohydrolase family protein [Deltaproteobacteria bacterium]